MTTISREETTQLALRSKSGDHDAFRELEKVARPLLVSLSNKFANYHHKFEYDDFYAIGLSSLYAACISFKEGNPSFLDYAKIIILRDFWKQINYWNAERRNIFENTEIPVDSLVEMGIEPVAPDDIDDYAFRSEFRDRISEIIDENYDPIKSRMIKMYLIHDHKIIDIANDMKLDYKNVYALIQRGVRKVTQEYTRKHLP